MTRSSWHDAGRQSDIQTMEQAKIPERYRLLCEVGQGGMAVVYRAIDETLKREVAIKILHQHLASEPESKARLEREAQSVAKLHHENILEIFDYSGLDSPSSYIVTEFIDGQTLKELLAARPFEYPELAALVAVEICGALSHAHAAGIIHRDVKPENVMIRKDGVLKLMDFGIAQVIDLQRMTVTGQLLGSPAYMAPELIEGKPLDFRTDVFAVGIMLYQLATGSLPFAGKNPHEVLRRIVEGKFPDPRSVNRRVSDGLARFIGRALARRPDDRYAAVDRLTADLREHLAEAGLFDVKAELRTFFAEPGAYEAALPARMAAALSATAEAALRAGRKGKAIEAWSRVLAFDPANASVLAALRRLEGRARARRAAVVAGAAGVLVVALLGLGRLAEHARRGAARAPTGVLPVARHQPAAVAAPARPEPDRAVLPKLRGEDLKRHSTGSHAGMREAARGSEATRTFGLGPTPQNVDVYLDGKKQFAYDTDHRTLTVPWAERHVVEFRSPAGCCFVERVEVGPDRPLPPDDIIARRLKWRPAALRITTEPDVARGTRIMVRDPNRAGAGTIARAGEEVDVPFFAEDEGSKEIEIAIDSGDVFTSERVTVRAGQRLAHVVKLRTSN
ncbi:MAG TPA: serine/threonine-protein kinase [Polyangia bacterium]|nr:serine/threonine-protein kinase [Polyangia bacterium]